MQATDPVLLIADDDRDFRESLCDVFTRRGYSIELAADGYEAVELVQSAPQLHLMLMDVHMPRLTGLEALVQIRELVQVELPCILMSAKFDDHIKQRAAQLDTASMLSKPFTLQDVTGTVSAVLQHAYGWEA